MNIHRFVCGFSVKSEIKPKKKIYTKERVNYFIVAWSRINECDEDDAEKVKESIIFTESCSTLSWLGVSSRAPLRADLFVRRQIFLS